MTGYDDRTDFTRGPREGQGGGAEGYFFRTAITLPWPDRNSPLRRFSLAWNATLRTNESAACVRVTVSPLSAHVPAMSALESPPPSSDPGMNRWPLVVPFGASAIVNVAPP